jgi:disulfide bond formation protein DsbB
MASAAQPVSAPLSGVSLARAIALIVPMALLGGALGSQYVGGLHPCEMCYWQRWPHGAAILLAGAAFVLPARARMLTALAALAIAISGAIGVYHAGVEMGWWEGLTTCTAGGALSLDELMKVPLIRCDQIQWSLFGISMAGWNAIISLASFAVISLLLLRSRP